jgi:hypothetical protein
VSLLRSFFIVLCDFICLYSFLPFISSSRTSVYLSIPFPFPSFDLIAAFSPRRYSAFHPYNALTDSFVLKDRGDISKTKPQTRGVVLPEWVSSFVLYNDGTDVMGIQGEEYVLGGMEGGLIWHGRRR